MPSFISIDVETANNDISSICQIGMVRFECGEAIESYNRLINPRSHFLGMNTSIHGIDAEMVKRAPKFFEVFDEIDAWLSSGIVTSHSFFDRSAIYRAIIENLMPQRQYQWLDATTIIRRTWQQYSKRGYGLGNLARDFEIDFKHHDACEDARVSGLLLCRAIIDSGKTLEEWHQTLKPKPKRDKTKACSPKTAF
jgi:DNA polymerase-3 subunit epsilon